MGGGSPGWRIVVVFTVAPCLKKVNVPSAGTCALSVPERFLRTVNSNLRSSESTAKGPASVWVVWVHPVQ